MAISFSLSKSVLVLFIGYINIKVYFGVFSGSMTAHNGCPSKSRLNKIFVFKISDKKPHFRSATDVKAIGFYILTT